MQGDGMSAIYTLLLNNHERSLVLVDESLSLGPNLHARH